MLSERSLGGRIGFGGSAQAGEKLKHCCCAGTDKVLDRQLIEHNFFLSLSHTVYSCSVGLVEVDLSESR